ncbi:MAG TPA: hypothetical protein VII59_01130, partial [Streptosporangiaceae bacterium]
ALPASAQPARPAAASTSAHEITDRQILFGDKLHHKFRLDGNGAWRSESLTSPDDITELGHHLFVTFQNGVGPQGTPSTDGNTDSTLVEFTLGGRWVNQWDVVGKCDGLTADPAIGAVIATVNEDAHSSLYAITVATGRLQHYRYSEPLPHNGGTDAISIYRGQILISASAPGTTGKAAPQPAYPAVYLTTLRPKTGIAQVRALYDDEAQAKAVNGPHAGELVRLALTDPDSNEVVPWSSPRFAGDFMLTSQGDKEQIFDHPSGWRQNLDVLRLSNSVDDTAWATDRRGALYTTDQTTDTVDEVYGAFTVGTAYSAVTSCDAGDAPAVCPAPGFPPNYLATDNLRTGALTPVKTVGPRVHPQGMIFVGL